MLDGNRFARFLRVKHSSTSEFQQKPCMQVVTLYVSCYPCTRVVNPCMRVVDPAFKLLILAYKLTLACKLTLAYELLTLACELLALCVSC